jgi:hypothetical protein
MCTDQVIAEVDLGHAFPISLEPYEGLSLLTDPHPASRRQPINDDRAWGTE